MTLKTLQNFYKATTSRAWAIGTGNRYVSTLPTPSAGYLVISPSDTTKREIIAYSGTGTDSLGSYVTVTTRGVGGTTEQAHSKNEPVRMNIIAQHYSEVQDEVTDLQGQIDTLVLQNAPNASTTTRGIVLMSTAPSEAGTAIVVATTDPKYTKIDDIPDHFVSVSTGAGDAGSGVVLNASGVLDRSFIIDKVTFTPNAGETINGATLPVAVYQNKTDNEVYACDGNDATKYKFIGFAITNSTDGNAITVKTNGIVSGFTGLAEGEKYYVQDDKTIGTTPSTTMEILVGIAVSETQLLIQKGKLRASGTTTFDSTTNTVITTGFRVSAVRIFAINTLGSDSSPSSFGGWTVMGGNKCSYASENDSAEPQAGVDTVAWRTYRGSSAYGNRGNVSTITDTSFRLDNTSSASNQGTVNIYWEAEGEL